MFKSVYSNRKKPANHVNTTPTLRHIFSTWEKSPPMKTQPQKPIKPAATRPGTRKFVTVGPEGCSSLKDYSS